MSLVTEILGPIKRVALMDETLQNTKAALTSTSDKLGRLIEEFQRLERRLDRLEDAFNNAKPQIDEVAKLRERLAMIETARSSDVARIDAAIAQLAAQRQGLEADVERHLTRLERTLPQLPPANPTDN